MTQGCLGPQNSQAFEGSGYLGHLGASNLGRGFKTN